MSASVFHSNSENNKVVDVPIRERVVMTERGRGKELCYINGRLVSGKSMR